MGPNIFFVQKNMGKKNEQKKGYRKNLGPTKYCSKIIMGPTFLLSIKISVKTIWIYKNVGPKQIRVHKILGPTNIGSPKIGPRGSPRGRPKEWFGWGKGSN